MNRAVLLPLFYLFLAGTAAAGGGPQNVLLLINRRSPDSIEVGEHYARARGLHPLNVLRLDLPATPEISFSVYETTVAEPVARYLERTGLGPQIDYIVTTQGFPLRLALPKGSPQRHLSLTAALQALDTDLSALTPTPAGRANPYFGLHQAFAHEQALAGGKIKIRLSAMLAGFSATDAKRLVDRAIEAEKLPPPRGLFLFQDARGNAKARNDMYPRALELLTAEKLEARRIGSGTGALKQIPPLICWYSGGSYSGLDRETIRGLKFRPGAIVDMVQSFGAVPANFVDDGKFQQVPIAWAVEAGATGVHGAVAEPYTIAFPDPGTALLYAGGFNLAEAFFARIRTFWWQNLLLGDPLCAPFARRPEFTCGLDDQGAEPVQGRFAIAVEGQNLAGSELFVEGLRVARAGPGEALVWDTLALPDGPAHVRVTAFSDDPTRIQAHRLYELPVLNPCLRLLGFAREGPGPSGALLLDFSRAPALPPAPGALVLSDADGRPLPFALEQGLSPRTLRLVPRAPLRPSHTYSFSVTSQLVDSKGVGLASTFEGSFRTTAAALALAGPAMVRAGSSARFELEALATPDGPRDEGFSAKVRLSITDPAAQAPASITLAAGHGALALRFLTAGTWTIAVEDPDSGLKGSSTIRVEPAAFASVELIAPKEWPAGHALPVTLVGRDAFGNETPSPSPPLTVSFGTAMPVTTVIAGESRTSLLFQAPWSAGETELSIRDGEREAGKTQIKLIPGPLRRWLCLGPFAPARSRLEPPPPPRVLPEPGLLHEGRPWLPEEASASPAPLPWLGQGRSGWIALPLHANARQTVELRIGLAGLDCTVHLDGRKLAHAPATEEFIENVLTLKLPLGPGQRWLGLALSRPGSTRPQLSLELSSPDGPPDLCLYPHHPLQPPERFTVSGRLQVGSHGLPSLRVELTGPTGTSLARTDADGFYVFRDLAPGRYRLRPAAANLAFVPPARNLLSEQEHFWHQDFAALDDEPPTLRVLAPRPGASAKRRLRVQFQAEDNLALAEIRLLINGQPIGDPLTPPANRADLPIEDLAPGAHILTVIAQDHAGNQTKLEIPFVK